MEKERKRIAMQEMFMDMLLPRNVDGGNPELNSSVKRSSKPRLVF
jgi:hypothetical protein